MFGPRAVEAYLHETVAPAILGRAVEPVEELSDGLEGYVGFASSGAETRGNSAVDIALWDLSARSRGVPLHRLLGAETSRDIPVYNTCAGPYYMRRGPEVAPRNWGISGAAAADTYEDLDAFLHRADELAASLLGEGIRGMKMWPFDPAAEASNGQYLSLADLSAALEPIRKVRRAVGRDIDVMIELHGMWSVPMAQRIAAALEEYEPRWIEDPVRPHDFGALARVAHSTRIPIAAGETLGGPTTHERMMDRDAVRIDIVDIAWSGGITAARRVAAMAATRGLELALHDCTGPVGLAVATHLAVATPNVEVQEIVRAFTAGWYGEVATDVPPIERGRIRPPAGPGLGLELRPELLAAPGTHVHSSRFGA
jgi:L-alanine-DL-glutamate epimerase-like enolase superfamily enzyme